MPVHPMPSGSGPQIDAALLTGPPWDVAPLALFLAAAILTVNLFAFLQMALDKAFARRALRRIPERRLILPAYIGGAPGVWLAMALLRHKTRKAPFRLRLTLPTLASVLVGAVLLIAASRG